MLNDKTTEICKRLDWSIYLDANEDVELRKESPAGEDFSICVDSKNFIQNVKEYAANFDIDEHIELWIEAKRNGVKGVPSARELVYDAEAICKMLQELAAALAKEEPALVRASTRRFTASRTRRPVAQDGWKQPYSPSQQTSRSSPASRLS